MPNEPVRTCVGCRQRAPKRDLLRMALGPDGIRPDPGGSAPGRGAHLHPSPDCVRAAVRSGALARSLRASITAEEASNLLREIEREALRTKE